MSDIFRSIKRKEAEEEEDFQKKMTKGAILVLDDVPKHIRRDALKEQFNNYGTCSWVDLDEEKGEVFPLLILLVANHVLIIVQIDSVLMKQTLPRKSEMFVVQVDKHWAT